MEAQSKKKIFLIHYPDGDIKNNIAQTNSFMKKAVIMDNYSGGDINAEISKLQSDLLTIIANPEELNALAIDNYMMIVVDLNQKSIDAFNAILSKVMELSDRHTMVIIATKSKLIFKGFGITTKNDHLDRIVTAADIIPTISYVTDLPIPSSASGTVLYQILKDPNMKLNEINKLKDALSRMETALQRGSREPWDKHDCA